MKLTVTLALLAFTQAISNLEEESEEARSVWVPAATKYKSVTQKGCNSSW